MSKNGLLGLVNTTDQSVVVGGLVNLGTSYRHFGSKNNCGFATFSFNSNGITLNHRGIYKVTVAAIVSAPAAGDVTLQLEENGVLIPGAIATETITTAVTESRTLIIDYFILVDNDLILNFPTTAAKTITIRNTGIESTIENIVINVTKEV